MACCHGILIGYSRRRITRKGTKLPSPEKWQLGQWPWLPSQRVKEHYKEAYAKTMSRIFGVRSSRLPWGWGLPSNGHSVPRWLLVISRRLDVLLTAWRFFGHAAPLMLIILSWLVSILVAALCLRHCSTPSWPPDALLVTGCPHSCLTVIVF